MFTRGRLALILLSAGLFAVLTILALEINSPWMTEPDTWAWDWLDTHRTYRWQRDSSDLFSYIGRPVHVAVAGLVSGTLLAVQARSIWRLVVVAGAVGAGAALEQTLKALIGRTSESLAGLQDGSMPDLRLIDDYAHSFPSGHVTGAATLFGTVAVCIGTGRTGPVKAALAVAAIVGVLSVSVLALYVRAHLFTDVIGGMVLGGALVTLGAAAIVRSPIRQSRTRTV